MLWRDLIAPHLVAIALWFLYLIFIVVLAMFLAAEPGA